jgi:hypothetical protein
MCIRSQPQSVLRFVAQDGVCLGEDVLAGWMSSLGRQQTHVELAGNCLVGLVALRI